MSPRSLESLSYGPAPERLSNLARSQRRSIGYFGSARHDAAVQCAKASSLVTTEVMTLTSNEIDRATIDICEGKPLLGRWSYTLDTSNDDDYPFISYGQLLLRGDGVVFQRVCHTSPEVFG